GVDATDDVQAPESLVGNAARSSPLDTSAPGRLGGAPCKPKGGSGVTGASETGEAATTRSLADARARSCGAPAEQAAATGATESAMRRWIDAVRIRMVNGSFLTARSRPSSSRTRARQHHKVD